jgi:HEAT repeat protein
MPIPSSINEINPAILSMSSPEVTLDQIDSDTIPVYSTAAEDFRALLLLLGDEDWQTRRAAADAIASISRSRANEYDLDLLFTNLISLMKDRENAGKRAAAVAVLETLGPRILSRIARELQYADSPVQIMLINVIGAAGGIEAVRLLSILIDEKEINQTSAAVSALGRTKSSAALPFLLQYLNSSNEWLQFAAISALGELGDEGAIEKLEPLLGSSLLQEVVATALSEIGTLNALQALARNLLDAAGKLRPTVLKAMISLLFEERTLPKTVLSVLRDEGWKLFHQQINEAAFNDLLLKMMGAGVHDHGLANACLIALGWAGDKRSVPIISRALTDPTTSKAAHKAIGFLCYQPQALTAMAKTAQTLIPRLTLATAFGNVPGIHVIETAVNLSLEATDNETHQACASAINFNREWLRQHARQISVEEARHLANFLHEKILETRDQVRIEIAELIGTLSNLIPDSIQFTISNIIPESDEEDLQLARLILLDRTNSPTVLEEAIQAAQHHQSATVRMHAIDIYRRRIDPELVPSIVKHLSDESAGVRRIATRSLRAGIPTSQVHRALLAGLADRDIWVIVEAIVTLGELFGNEPDTRTLLRLTLASPHPLTRIAIIQALSNCATKYEWKALSQLARNDPQSEVRRSAVLAFAKCPNTRSVLSVMRAALKDQNKSVRRAAIEALASNVERPAQTLILSVVSNEKEDATIRGAALRALTKRASSEAIEMACLIIGANDPTLIEDSFDSILSLRETNRLKIYELSKACPPRVASLITFILENNLITGT